MCAETMTKEVNVFNPNIRKIKCIENEHDYLEDGLLFKEMKLEKGTIYTFIKGEMKQGHYLSREEIKQYLK